MDILRWGSQRDRGTKYVISGLRLNSGTGQAWQDNVQWNEKTKQIIINAAWVPLGDGRTNHTYSIRLSLEDVSALVAILGHAGSAGDASLLRDHLRNQVPDLVKLLACATGLVPTPLKEKTPVGSKLA